MSHNKTEFEYLNYLWGYSKCVHLCGILCISNNTIIRHILQMRKKLSTDVCSTMLIIKIVFSNNLKKTYHVHSDTMNITTKQCYRK